MTLYYESSKKRKFAAGLLWLPHKGAVKKKVIQENIQSASDLYELRHKERPSVGCFVKSESLKTLIAVGGGDGGKKKNYSLAALASVANIHEINFIGRLALDEKNHWILVCWAGIIAPAGDRIVDASESDRIFEEIRSHQKSLTVAFDSTEVSTSGELIEGWLAKTGRSGLFAIVPAKEVGAPPKSQKKMMAALGVIGVCSVIGLTGRHFYLEHEAKKMAEQRAQAQLLREQLARAQEAEKPWESWPALSDVYNACAHAYFDRQKEINSWELVGWRCNDSRALEQWNRTGIGSFSLPPVGDGSINLEDPNNLSHEIMLPEFSPEGRNAINEKGDAARYLMDLARLHEVSISISWGSEEKRSIPKGDSFIQEGLGYAKNSATFRLNSFPESSFLEGLAAISAIKLGEIQNRQSNWELSVDFFTTYED